MSVGVWSIVGMTSTPLRPTVPGSAGPVAALMRAAALVDEVGGTMWAARSGAELTGTVKALALLRAKLDAVELAVVRELDSGPNGQEALRGAGWASINDYLTHTDGGRRTSGPSTLKLARRLEQFPALMAALEAGQVSRVKATIVATAVERLPMQPDLRDRALAILIDDA